MLLDLSQTANLSASMTAAERVLQSLDRVVNVRKTKVQQAGLMVLKSPDIPSMLVETAYISNPGEEARLKSDAHQAKHRRGDFHGRARVLREEPAAGHTLRAVEAFAARRLAIAARHALTSPHAFAERRRVDWRRHRG